MTLKKSAWYHHHLPAIAYVLQHSAGSLVFDSPDVRAALDSSVDCTLSDALSDPRDGEWETEIGRIVNAQDTGALYQLVEQSAFASRRASFAGAAKSEKRAESSRENGKKGGRPRNRSLI